MKPMTQREKELTSKNVLAACKDINKRNKRGCVRTWHAGTAHAGAELHRQGGRGKVGGAPRWCMPRGSIESGKEPHALGDVHGDRAPGTGVMRTQRLHEGA